MHKIPVTMATQHPDNAGPSPFTGKRFVSNAEEIDECYQCFKDLGVHEYMWDWEGKFVDEAVIDRLYQKHTEFFQKNQIGKDVFLTFRVPNIWEGETHRLPRAFMNIIAAEKAARTYKFNSPPIFEIILPMATSAKQLIYLQEKFSRIAASTEDIFEMKSRMKHIQVIPLFETMETMFGAKEIMKTYLAYLKKEHKFTPKYLRIFIARSDPAMNTGLIPAMISCEAVMSSCRHLMNETGIPVYPWIGGGSLPFRGAINPDNVTNVLQEYAGAYSLTIQSAFRCDYDLAKVKRTIKKFNTEFPTNWKKYKPLTEKELKALKQFTKKVTPYFQQTVEKIAPLINRIASKFPSHRERVQHIGLFGYSRGVGKVKLPRAIKFTGSLYSLGIPPEFIGTGRVLQAAQKEGVLDLVKKCYYGMRDDLIHAGHYLNRENLDLLCQEDKAWEDLRIDIDLVEKYLEEPLGPYKVHHMIHRNFTSNIFYKMSLDEDFSEDVLRAAEMRKSLG